MTQRPFEVSGAPLVWGGEGDSEEKNLFGEAHL